ncbi:MAG TPA: pinensin family lanthipeptide [Longimicrobium sp.]|nr:pinensin family lanthipeptide [Longimicrobium sp.]
MKKLQLDGLKVDSFATSDGIDAMRGTVAGYSAKCTFIDCPYSHDGTCVMTGCQPCYTDPPCG